MSLISRLLVSLILLAAIGWGGVAQAAGCEIGAVGQTVRTSVPFENPTARGAYVLKDAVDAKATIFATGSEVEIALEAARSLETEGIAARVVSMPSFELFEAQDEAYRTQVLGETGIKVAVEAAIRQGWDRYIGADGIFVGMTGFGASAPAKALYKHFGITAEAVVKAVKARI